MKTTKTLLIAITMMALIATAMSVSALSFTGTVKGHFTTNDGRSNTIGLPFIYCTALKSGAKNPETAYTGSDGAYSIGVTQWGYYTVHLTGGWSIKPGDGYKYIFKVDASKSGFGPGYIFPGLSVTVEGQRVPLWWPTSSPAPAPAPAPATPATGSHSL